MLGVTIRFDTYHNADDHLVGARMPAKAPPPPFFYARGVSIGLVFFLHGRVILVD